MELHSPRGKVPSYLSISIRSILVSPVFVAIPILSYLFHPLPLSLFSLLRLRGNNLKDRNSVGFALIRRLDPKLLATQSSGSSSSPCLQLLDSIDVINATRSQCKDTHTHIFKYFTFIIFTFFTFLSLKIVERLKARNEFNLTFCSPLIRTSRISFMMRCRFVHVLYITRGRIERAQCGLHLSFVIHI